MLTIHQDQGYLVEAAQAGVEGYVLKDVDPRELIRAIRTAAQGLAYLDPELSRRLRQLRPAGGGRAGDGGAEGPSGLGGGGAVGRSAVGGEGAGRAEALGAVPPWEACVDTGLGPAPGGATGPSEPLTRREEEVLALLAQGSSNRQIAERLYISEKTVKNHISHILEKLGVQDRLQAAVLAMKRGWVGQG
ncbi:MAG: response regulator transcription factor [Acetobacteraceae bacterium]|nr:response regulator transcription factor [Acetobacteraceae bacterium]